MVKIKGMALETIGFLIIALFGIVLLMIFVSGSLSDLIKNSFCYFYEKISSKRMDMCKSRETVINSVTIKPKDSKDLARYIAAYSIMCWEDAVKSLKSKDTTCYGIKIEGNSITPAISEVDVTDILINEGGCNRIENSKAKNRDGSEEEKLCGSNDNLYWDVDGNLISDQKLILIKYEDKYKRIVIKA